MEANLETCQVFTLKSVMDSVLNLVSVKDGLKGRKGEFEPATAKSYRSGQSFP